MRLANFKNILKIRLCEQQTLEQCSLVLLIDTYNIHWQRIQNDRIPLKSVIILINVIVFGVKVECALSFVNGHSRHRDWSIFTMSQNGFL